MLRHQSLSLVSAPEEASMKKAEDTNVGHGWSIVYWCKAIIYYNTKEILERVTSVCNKIFYLFQVSFMKLRTTH